MVRALALLAVAAAAAAEEICYEEDTKCDSWLLFLPATNAWAAGTRATLYVIGLLYCFLGIAIVSDIFMSSIEVITSKTRRVTTVGDDGEPLEIEVKVWNGTVANLTLLALASSAPEILLASIETVSNLGGEPGELGPSTIVGSAAFNLLFITAVCVMSIPNGEVKRITEFKVFVITAFFSVFAYAWLYIVLEIWGPNEVSIPEAVVTFLFFPVLVFLAYGQDRKWWRETGQTATYRTPLLTNVKVNSETIDGGSPNLNRIAEMIRTMSRPAENTAVATSPTNFSVHSDEPAKLIPEPAHVSALKFRLNAVRRLSGKRRVLARRVPLDVPMDDVLPVGPGTLQFRLRNYVVLENAGNVVVDVERTNGLTGRVSVDYATCDVTAEAGSDYEARQGTLWFDEGENSKTIEIPIIDDDEAEDDETFLIELANPTGGATLGDHHSTSITIIDDDVPGVLGFNMVSVTCGDRDGKAELRVERTQGCSGAVTVEYYTADATARQNTNYLSTSGTLKFAAGENSKVVEVPILEGIPLDSSVYFRVILAKPTGGARLDVPTRVCEVTISDDTKLNKLAHRVVDVLKQRQELMDTSTSTWAQQFEDAVTMEGETDDDGNKLPPTVADYVLHILTFGWKVIMAFIPPSDMGGAWPRFACSLIAIGAITAVVGEFAGLLGCVIGLDDSVVAITFVALGTSLPDTFASRQAAVEAPDADAAIGNVTGSNGVNVFLGLGVPWLIASIYYQVKEGTPYPYPAGDLVFSVSVFAGCAALCLGTLVWRRFSYIGTELGGPTTAKYATGAFFIFLWFMYVLLSALQTYDYLG